METPKVTLTITSKGWEVEASINGKQKKMFHELTKYGSTQTNRDYDFEEDGDLSYDLSCALEDLTGYDVARALEEFVEQEG